MIPTNKDRQWSEVKALGVSSGIKDMQKYITELVKGEYRARRLAEDKPFGNPPGKEMRLAHHLMFKEVHPWAGEYRKEGQQTPVPGGFPGCDSNRIPTEIAMLEKQMEELIRTSRSKQEKMAAISFHHVRLMRIAPFLDGNGRTGRVLIEEQLCALFGQKDRMGFHDRHTYLKAMEIASKTENLAPLTNLLLRREELPQISESQPLKPRFRIAPFFDGLGRGIDEEIERSRSVSPTDLPEQSNSERVPQMHCAGGQAPTVSSTQQSHTFEDRQYLAALQAGNLAAAQALVDRAAGIEDPGESPTHLPDWLLEGMDSAGLKPNRMLNDVDMERPDMQSVLRNDPILPYLKRTNPGLATEFLKGNFTAREYRLTVERQRKGADPVIYRGNGTPVPLSERFPRGSETRCKGKERLLAACPPPAMHSEMNTITTQRLAQGKTRSK